MPDSVTDASTGARRLSEPPVHNPPDRWTARVVAGHGRVARHGPVVRYGVAVLLAAASVAVTVALAPVVPRTLFVFAFAAVTLAAWAGGVGPGFVAAGLSVLGIDYYLIPPARALRPTDPADLIPLGIFMGVAGLIGTLTQSLRTARDAAAAHATDVEDAARQLREQALELERANQQLQEQSVELELSNQQLQEQAAELEAANEELRGTTEELMQRSDELALARDAAEAERERLNRVVTQLPAAVAVYEGPGLRFRAVSTAYRQIIGGRDVVGQPIREALPELAGAEGEDATDFFALLERVYATGVPFVGTDLPARWDDNADGVAEAHVVDVVYAPLRGAGAEGAGTGAVDHAVDGAVEGVIALVLDVSERARLARAEREASVAAEHAAARVAAVLDSLPDAAAVYDSAWRYTYLNPAARTLHQELLGLAGVPPAQAAQSALGRVAWEVFPWLVGTRFDVESRRAVADGRVVEYVEYVAPLARWYETRIVPTTTGAVSLNRDVTAQHAAEAERARLLEVERQARAEAERLREAAEVANRAKAQFLATMSHELRTPLNAIQGYVQLLGMGLGGPVTAEQQQTLARIDRAQRHLLGLITDILNYARLESGRVEYDVRPIELAALVADVVPIVEPQIAARGLTLTVHLDEDDHSEHAHHAVRAPGAPAPHGVRAPVTVWADREKLAQVLLNLLSNAIKFTPAGGRVRLELVEPAGGPREPDVAFVRVADTGPGIPADKLEAIFEPFVQLHTGYARPQEGTGLGLAISRDLARGMGGDLRARSTPGAGATLTLTLRRVVTADGEPMSAGRPENRPEN
jgi:signal transduction histidine kinase